MSGTLVLARKDGQTICIGEDITITVMECRPGKCKVVVRAPREVAVHRLEVFEQLQQADTIMGGVLRDVSRCCQTRESELSGVEG